MTGPARRPGPFDSLTPGPSRPGRFDSASKTPRCAALVLSGPSRGAEPDRAGGLRRGPRRDRPPRRRAGPREDRRPASPTTTRGRPSRRRCCRSTLAQSGTAPVPAGRAPVPAGRAPVPAGRAPVPAVFPQPVIPPAANVGLQRGVAGPSAELAARPGEQSVRLSTRHPGSVLGRPMAGRRAGPWRPASGQYADPGIRAGSKDSSPAAAQGPWEWRRNPGSGAGSPAAAQGPRTRRVNPAQRPRTPRPAAAEATRRRGPGPGAQGPRGLPLERALRAGRRPERREAFGDLRRA